MPQGRVLLSQVKPTHVLPHTHTHTCKHACTTYTHFGHTLWWLCYAPHPQIQLLTSPGPVHTKLYNAWQQRKQLIVTQLCTMATLNQYMRGQSANKVYFKVVQQYPAGFSWLQVMRAKATG